VESLFFFEFLQEVREVGVWSCHQFFWRSVLKKFSVAEHCNSIWLNDGVQTVSDRDYCWTLEFGIHKLQDFLLCSHVDVRSGFVEHDYLGLAQHCSANADELAFSWWKVAACFLNFVVEYIFLRVETFQQVWETGLFHERFNRAVRNLSSWVNIVF